MSFPRTCVPTGMKTGVSTVLWGSTSSEARAMLVPHLARSLNVRAADDDDSMGATGAGSASMVAIGSTAYSTRERWRCCTTTHLVNAFLVCLWMSLGLTGYLCKYLTKLF